MPRTDSTAGGRSPVSDVIETYFDEQLNVWKNRARDGSDYPGVYDRRGGAIASGGARAIAERCAHLVRDATGAEDWRKDYGSDPQWRGALP